MTHKTIVSVASYVQQLAKDNNVTANRDGMSRVAVTITALADDSVELDNVEQLLVNLKRKVYSVKLKFYSFRDVTSANKSTFIKKPLHEF
jgi:hypothetical protein